MIESALIALVATVIASILIYAFRVRQLYVVLPSLFSESALTSTGKLIEIRVFNKSRSTEEDVLLSLSPERRYELVASTDATPTLDRSTISIPRIPPGDDFSLLMMVEGGSFSKDQISTISSKTTKGSVVDAIEQVPPNLGNVILSIAVFVILVGTPIAGVITYDKWKDGVSERERVERIESFSFLKNLGWSSLERYAFTDLSKNYSPGEFPLFEKDMVRNEGAIIVPFSIVNKSAAALSVRAMPERPFSDQDPRSWKNSIIETATVSPGEMAELSVSVFWPEREQGEFSIEFTLDSGSDRYIQVTKRVHVDA